MAPADKFQVAGHGTNGKLHYAMRASNETAVMGIIYTGIHDHYCVAVNTVDAAVTCMLSI